MSDAEIPLRLSLDSVGADQHRFVGGKAASLATLRAAGFPVPDAFVLTTAAFSRIIECARLEQDVARVRALPGSGRLGSNDARSLLAEIRARIEAAPFPEDVREALLAAHRELRADAVSVRSSGVSEDLEGASFAGLYETVLSVRGDDALLEAVRRCAASVFRERVLSYLERRVGGNADIAMAIVVQRMITSEASGVLFTVDPTSGKESEMLLEAVAGLGDALVSGIATGARYVLGASDGRVLQRRDGDGPAPPLPDAMLSAIAETGAAVQEHYGRPMDIEWAVADGQLHLLQARPITALQFSPDLGSWTTADMRDGGVSSDVCSPFMWSLYELALEHSMPGYFREIGLLRGGVEIKWGRMFFARPYWNLKEVKNVLEAIPGYVERNFDVDLGIEPLYDGPGKTTSVTVRGILRALPVLFALRRCYREQLEKDAAYARRFAERKAPYDLAPSDLAALADGAFAARYRSLITDLYFETETTYFTTIYNTSNSKLDFKVHFERARRATGGDLSYLKLVSGLRDLSHLRPMRDLHALAGRIKAEGRAIDEGTVRAFADSWRHKSSRELDIRVPRWRDDLPFVRALIEQAVKGHDPAHEPEASARAQHAAYVAERDRAARALRFRPLARRSFLAWLERVRQYAWWREEMRDYSSRLYDLVRLWSVEAARRLVRQGAIEREDDIWYVPFQDALDAVDGKLAPAAVRARARAGRRMVRSFRSFRNPNEIRSGAPDTAPAARGAALLSGTPCSAGRVRGTARVLRALEEMDRVQSGDVLVAVFTDPGWTPLFSSIAAVVTEAGGLLSHAALVAREYGIPAVLAVSGATSLIPDGATVEVDGSAGTVRVVAR